MLYGVDVSHHNGRFDFARAALNGKKYAYVKCTEGDHYFDPQFARNWIEAPKAGMYVGAYHFFHPKQDAVLQANWFLRCKGPRLSNELPPVLDWESLDGLGGRVNISQAQKWLDIVESRTGVTPIIYASPGFIEGLLSPLTGFERYPLWIAHYGVHQPRLPHNGPWKTWTFWQTSDQGGLDLDKFNGGPDQLQRLASAISV